MTDDKIREIFMAHGFTVKEGQTDLKPYVYAAARALLAAGASEGQEPIYQVKYESGAWLDVTKDYMDMMARYGYETRTVYTTPPKPCLHVQLRGDTCENCGARFELL